jgi:aromatic-L-amino-acid/L-tryptophan decarboxylase
MSAMRGCVVSEPLGPVPSLGDIPPALLRRSLHEAADWVADYRQTIEQRRIVPDVKPGEIASALPAAVPESPVAMTTIMRELDALVMPGIVHWGHPAFLGYFGSTSNGPAVIGELIAAALNVSAMTWQTSPAATELETVVLRWIGQMVGLPASFTGIVYDTASIALLHALAAARECCAADVRQAGLAGRTDVPVLKVYASDQAHSSIEKAAIALGIGERNVVRIQTAGDGRLDAAALRAAIDRDRAQGCRPLAVVATVGTTSTTSVDPVAEIAAVCADTNTWLHVDAAYGGAMAVLDEGRWVMAGTERADSVVVNPHKWMFVPLDFSALFVREPERLRAIFSFTPDYLNGDAGGGDIDYMDYGLQLGRRFRALKAWMVFRAFGRQGLAARIREHCRLARLWAGWVADDPRFALAAPVPMAVVCFRALGGGPDLAAADRLNEQVVAEANASGDVYLTHTRVGGRTAIRMAVGNILTTERHLAAAWARVRDITERLGALGAGAQH